MILRFSVFAYLALAIFSSAPAQEYYPLAVGNEWFYRAVNPSSEDSAISESIRITGDSLFSNGLRYFCLNRENIFHAQYVRHDFNAIYFYNPVFGRDVRVFNLEGRIGDVDTIGFGGWWTMELASIDSFSIFGIRDRVLTFSTGGTLSATMRLSEKFGPIAEWGYGDPPPPWPEGGRELAGCIIDGINYGFTPKTALAEDYYPLNVGNEWFYQSQCNPPVNGARVVGDSLFPNGKRYFILNRPDFIWGRYVRIDSSVISYYDEGDHPVFNLGSTIGEWIPVSWRGQTFIRLSRVGTVSVFGESRRVYTFEFDGWGYNEFRLCEKFGPLSGYVTMSGAPPLCNDHRDVIGCIIDGIQYGTTLGAFEEQKPPAEFQLSQNYPNPFNPTTQLQFSIVNLQLVTLKVYNLLGEEVAALVDEVIAPGTYTIRWDAAGLPSGVYLSELRGGGIRQVKRLVLLR